MTKAIPAWANINNYSEAIAVYHPPIKGRLASTVYHYAHLSWQQGLQAASEIFKFAAMVAIILGGTAGVINFWAYDNVSSALKTGIITAGVTLIVVQIPLYNWIFHEISQSRRKINEYDRYPTWHQESRDKYR